MERTKQKAMFMLTEQKVQVFITLAGVVVLLLATYITTKLSPLEQGIAINATSIENNETNLIKIEDRLIRIEGKIDNLRW